MTRPADRPRTDTGTDTSAGPRLLGPAEVRSLAADLGLRPTKQRGQNFVIDPNTVRRIVRTSGVGRDDCVLEVGPGLGSLTLALLAEAGHVVAVEVDDVLAAALPSTVARFAPAQAEHFSLVHADALRVTELPGPPPTALVANLPYNVSVPVLLHLLELVPTLQRVLVMVQAEVADRLAAPPGSRTYGVPSAKAAWYADVRRAGSVGRNVFWPAPNVDSGLVALTRREPPVTTCDRAAVFRVVDAAFAQRRKVLRGALSTIAPRPEVERALAAAGIDPLARGESLAITDFARIAEALGERGMNEVRVSAPAKINLHLGVGGVRPDGFHPLVTVFQAVGLYDELTLRPAEESSLTVSGEGVDVRAVPTGPSNLVLRAVELLGTHHGRDDLAVNAHLRKRIPVAGGLAGGSTDAAAALVGVDSLFELHTPRQELHDLAATLGSDVPFCLHGGTALGTGRGEELAPLMSRGDYWWVLLPDDAGLSTPAVYSAYDLLPQSHPELPAQPTDLVSALRVGDVARVGELLHNDLAGAAYTLRPDLAEVVAVGDACGAFGGLVSGSGPTVAFLCGDAEHASYVDGQLQESLGTAPGLIVNAPAHGARVVGARVGGIYQ